MLSQINKIPDVEFIAGDTVSFNCNVIDVDEAGHESVANIENCTLTLKMSYYGQEEVCVFSKNFTLIQDITKEDYFKITLSTDETINLYGSYTQQWVLKDSLGNKYVRAAGRVEVKRGIPDEV